MSDDQARTGSRTGFAPDAADRLALLPDFTVTLRYYPENMAPSRRSTALREPSTWLSILAVVILVGAPFAAAAGVGRAFLAFVVAPLLLWPIRWLAHQGR